jgi:sugar phosphate isomerase/epimerase
VRVGIQTNAWSDAMHRDELPRVLAEVAGAGYSGFEIGAHRVDLDRPRELRELVGSKGLTVLGIHSSANLRDPAALAEAEARISRIADFSVMLGAAFVPVSNHRTTDRSVQEYRAEAVALDRLGRLCADRGIRLAYHNHDWEVTEDYSGLRSLCERTDPDLVSLVLDVGWVARAGGDPVQAASRFRKRIAYFHLKDTLGGWFTELGRGTAGLDALGSALQGSWDGWLIVERDEAMQDPAESARLSREYLRTRWGV